MGYEDLVDIYIYFFFFFFFFLGGGGGGGHHKIGLYLEVISTHFLKVKVLNGRYFWVAKIQIFIWVLEIPDILLG